MQMIVANFYKDTNQPTLITIDDTAIEVEPTQSILEQIISILPEE